MHTKSTIQLGTIHKFFKLRSLNQHLSSSFIECGEANERNVCCACKVKGTTPTLQLLKARWIKKRNTQWSIIHQVNSSVLCHNLEHPHRLRCCCSSSILFAGRSIFSFSLLSPSPLISHVHGSLLQANLL